MAFTIDKLSPTFGISVKYWRIAMINIDPREKKAQIVFYGYASKEAALNPKIRHIETAAQVLEGEAYNRLIGAEDIRIKAYTVAGEDQGWSGAVNE